jgi:hypothetical protein
VASGLILQGCATPKPVAYGPIGPEAPHGYQDRHNPDGGFTVLVTMPPTTAVAELRAFFDRRAGELCPGGAERTNVFRVDRREQMNRATYVYQGVGVGSRLATGTELEGYVYCKAGAAAPAVSPRP